VKDLYKSIMKEKIQELEQEIKQLKEKLKKRYGLVWEDKPEIFDKKSKNAFPILQTKNNKKYPNIKTKTKNGNKPHILIEGDNYHSLSVLNYTHKGKIDLIYIDPPYNTGNKDFIYNDEIVDKEDSFRHSKWLSFMEKRLKLAKNLLTEDGVIFISIDDNEQAQLKLLCDDVFDEKNFVECISWEKKSSAKGVPPKNMIVNVHEYILVYQKSDKFSFIGELRSKQGFNNPDNDSRGIWRNTNIKSTIKSQSEKFIIQNPTNGDKFSDTWAFSKDTLDNLIKNNYLIFPKNKDGQVRKKEFFNEFKKENTPLKSSWGLFDNQQNTEMVKSILGETIFLNPKPVKIIDYLLSVSIRTNATILDFFAGSGTTAHAVLKLNKADGGNRQFILATNNENNICEDITYKRISKVMNGYTTPKGKKVDGLGGDLQYLKTSFIDKLQNTTITDEDKINLTYETSTILALKENTFDETKRNKFYQIFESVEKITAIYFSEDTEQLYNLVDELAERKKPVKMYIFSWNNGEFKAEFSHFENIIIEDIPEPILEIYQNLGVI
jgi:adenine-specific DNA-methyltransferase